MQVSLEVGEQLERRLVVQIPADRVDSAIDSRLKTTARTARVDGFRPGKVPVKVIEQRYGPQVSQEVLVQIMQETYEEAVQQQNLRPAGEPRFVPQPRERGEPFHYTAIVEVYPDIQLAPVDDFRIEKPVAEVSDADVDEMIGILQRQRAGWIETDQEARAGDRVTMQVQVATGDRRDGPHTQAAIVGQGDMPAAVDEALVGVRAGDRREIRVGPPSGASDAQQPGGEVIYAIEVQKIEVPELPALDDGFAAQFGVNDSGMEGLRREVKSNMQRELATRIQGRVKVQIMDALMKANPIEPPAAMVAEELGRLKERERLSEELDGAFGAPLSEEDMARMSHRRVALGLIVGEVVRSNNIQADPARVRKIIEGIAASYESPEDVANYYYARRELLSEVEAMALEEQVIEWVTGRAQVTEIPSSFKDIVKPKGTQGV